MKRMKYNPVMNAAERRHKARVQQQLCFGCGAYPTTAHHTLLTFDGKRWRRDHRMLLPVCLRCHTDIHDRFGNEAKWLASVGKSVEEAIAYIQRLWAASEADERRVA